MTDGEAIDPSLQGMTRSVNDVSKSKPLKVEEYSDLSSEVIESEQSESEIQSAKVHRRGSAVF